VGWITSLDDGDVKFLFVSLLVHLFDSVCMTGTCDI
jgi:hypothetical protein